MVNTGSLFSQILSLIRRDIFGKIVQDLRAEKAAKGFACWDQLVAMLFCQLAQAKSIREIQGGLQSCEGKLRHLGLTEAPKRSTLSYANKHRPWQVYEQLFYSVLGDFLGVRLHFSTALSICEGLWAGSVRATCSCKSAGSRLLRCSSLNVRKSSSDPLMYSPR